MLTEDGFIIMLARIEKLSADSARNADIAHRNTKNGAEMMRAREQRDQYLKDLRAAEAKIGEWAEYASLLRSAISPRRKGELPKMPKPLETDIPF